MATQLQGSWRTCESSRHAATPGTIRALLGRRQNGVEEQCGPTDPRTDEERRLGLGLAHHHRAGERPAERKPRESLSPRTGPPGSGGCLNPAWQTPTSSHPGCEERGQLHAIQAPVAGPDRANTHTHVCVHTCLLVYTQVHACVYAKLLQSCLILCCPGDCSPPGSSIHGDFPGKNTRMGCQALLQGIFPTRGSDLDLLHCRHQESPHKYTHACKHKRSWCTCIHIHTRVCIRTLTHAYRHTREHVYGD